MHFKALIATVCAVGAAAVAHAGTTTLSFFQIPSTNGNVNIASQLSVDVDPVAGMMDKVDFTFKNNVGVSSSISEVYFDAGSTMDTIFDTGAIENQMGTSFSYGSAAPPVLPGGASISPVFETTMGFLADAQGNPSVGVSTATDFLTIRIMLKAGSTFSDVLDGLNDGSIRLGMHIRSIGANGGSDAYVSQPPTTMIPLPSAAGLGLAGLAGMGMSRRRRFA